MFPIAFDYSTTQSRLSGKMVHDTGFTNTNLIGNVVKAYGIEALSLNKLLGHIQDSIGSTGQRNVATAISGSSMGPKIKLPWDFV